MADRLDVVSVRVEHEGSVIIRMVVRAQARRSVVGGPGCDRRRVEPVDNAAIMGREGDMRTEQQMIREWVDGQGEQNREIKRVLEIIARQPEKS